MSTYADDLAFPSSSNLLGETVQHPGMSLRDYFAAAALQGLLAANPGPTATSEFLAADAYGIADAMLEEKQK
jgi:hypothetical protein